MYHYSDKIIDNKSKRKLLITALISLIPFIGIIILGSFGWEEVTIIDYQISTYFYSLHSPVLDSVMIVVTHMGDFITQTLVAIFVVVTLLFLKKWRTSLWYGLTVLVGAGGLNAWVKEIYGRARPDQIKPLVAIGGYSFPSGHSMGSIIVYGGILFLLLRFVRSSGLKVLVSFLIVLLIMAIGLSRIYLGVHFPTDVVGGFSLGLFWLCLSIYLFGLEYTKIENRSKNRYSIKIL